MHKLETGETTSRELVEACLAQIDRIKPLNAYISTLEHESVMKRAEDLDRRRKEGGKPKLPLEGVPLAVKDNYNVKGSFTTCGSRMLSNFKSPYDSTVTARLEEAGALLIGKTNLDEFAMGSTTTKSAYGATINPWSISTGAKESMLTAGGSSGGSAAAVAAFSAYAATGTDTGGSVRLPASWTGLVGYKPTYGSSSRFGMVQYASSLDTPALFTRTVEDMTLLAPVIQGSDPNDSTSILGAASSKKLKKKDPKRKLRVGIPREYYVKEMNEDMLETWRSGIEVLAAVGCEIVDISLPHTSQSLPAYYIIAPAEASSNLARYDGVRYGHRSELGGTVQDMYTHSRSEGFGDEVQRRIMIGNFALSRKSYDSYYKKALQIRRLVRQDFNSVFEDPICAVDVILTPTAPSSAPSIEQLRHMDPIHHYITDIMTIPANLAGLPAVSVPVSLRSGLPVGLQLMAAAFDDDTLLQAAFKLEKPWRESSGKYASLRPFLE